MDVVSEKIKELPPYPFEAFHKKKQELQAKGVDVIDLGIGAPDLPTPDFIIDRLMTEARRPDNHQYAPFNGCQEFREAVAYFYESEYNVKLNPDKEVLTLIGSKEGLVHLIQAVTDPGDVVIVPNPGYPAYRTGVHLAGGKVIDLPLVSQNDYQPDYSSLPNHAMKNAKLMILNYPSNPTAATVELDIFESAIEFARKNNILLAHDAAYDLVTFDDYRAPSVLQVPGAKETAVEFGSLSKSFNMTGWRIGYVVGNETVIQALASLKSNVDTSQFLPIQKAAATALRGERKCVQENSAIFKRRMEKLHEAFKQLGIEANKPRGTIFLWAKAPNNYSSVAFAEKLLEEAGIIVTPGVLFGDQGEGYFRVALTVTEERIDEVIARLRKIDFTGEGCR